MHYFRRKKHTSIAVGQTTDYEFLKFLFPIFLMNHNERLDGLGPTSITRATGLRERKRYRNSFVVMTQKLY